MRCGRKVRSGATPKPTLGTSVLPGTPLRLHFLPLHVFRVAALQRVQLALGLRFLAGFLIGLDRFFERLQAAPGLLFLVIAFALMGEWASRRLRGNR